MTFTRIAALVACGAFLLVAPRPTHAIDSPIDDLAKWPTCGEGKEVAKLILRSTQVGAPKPGGGVEPRSLWHDFKEFRLGPESGPVTIHLRAWLRVGKRASSAPIPAAAQVVRMAEKAARGRPEKDDLHNRLGKAWQSPREGIEWQERFAIEGTHTADHQLLAVNVPLGPIQIDKKGRFSFVVHQAHVADLVVERARATVCSLPPVPPEA